MKQIGIVLSGCGVMDGAEIHESVLTLLAVDRAGAKAVCLAPNTPQAKVTDHYKKEDAGESRNVLTESARIARGEVKDLAQVKAADLDAVILPGGFGAALNLSDFAVKGSDCRVHSELERLLSEMLAARKPIGALCIAPAALAKVLQNAGIKAKLTIGRDRSTASALEAMGQEHLDCAVNDVIVDEEHLIVTTPAYMLANRISEVAEGAEKLVREVLRRA